MKTVMLSTLAAAATLLATSVAHADLASEVVTDAERTAAIVVAPIPQTRPFGVPNPSEFDANKPAEMGEMQTVPYRADPTPAAVPNGGLLRR
jgi:hypothetical protein